MCTYKALKWGAKMYSANIYDKLTETFFHTMFCKTKAEAATQAQLKIERLEKIYNAEECGRFEIDSYTVNQ